MVRAMSSASHNSSQEEVATVLVWAEAFGWF